MKMFQKLFTAVCLVAIVALVGCGDTKSPADKTPAEEKSPAEKTPAEKTPADEGQEPMPTVPTPDENPDVKQVNPEDLPKAGSGSTAKEDGVDINKE